MESREMASMGCSKKTRGFLSGQPMPKHGESLYPVLTLLALHVDYAETGITSPALVQLSKWHPGRVAGVIRRAHERGFLENVGRQRPPSVFARWSRLHGLTTLGRQAAFELYDRGDCFSFDDNGCLRLKKIDPATGEEFFLSWANKP